MHGKSHRSTGFTIVELLIVIVVIAILMTLITATYRGVRSRSNNNVTMANIKQYMNAIDIYQDRSGAYPPVPGETGTSVTMVCLGAGYTNGKCGTVTSTDVYESSSFMADLRSVSGVGVKDRINNVPGNVGGESFVGAAYGIDRIGPPAPATGYGRVIEWFLEGTNQKCQLPGAYAYNTASGNTACEVFIEQTG